MTAAEMGSFLKRLSSEVRTYHSPDDYGKFVLDRYNLLTQYRNGTAAFPPVFRESDRIFKASDMWVPGPGGHEAVAEEFGMRLPEDYLGFVQNYSEYILVRNVALWLLPAAEVKSCTSVFRRENEWDEDAPHSIFPFAGIVDSGGLLFAFRQLSPRVLDVVFFDPSATSEFEVMGPQATRFRSDASFTEWLLRMVETEGLPFRPGGEIDPEIYSVTRISNG